MPLIAIVEDESLVSLDIARSLAKAGYAVAGPWNSAESCLRSLEEGVKPDLLLVDIRLSGDIDGIELARTFSERNGPGAVFITAHSDDATLVRVNAAQPLGYLLKPFGERELLGTVGIALYRAGMERKLKESELRYRTLFERSISARFLCDSNGFFTGMNEAFSALCGPSPRRSRRLWGVERRWEGIFSALAGDGRFGPEELGFNTDEGREIRVLASLASLGEEGKGIVSLQGELVDQTEAAALRDAVAQVQKMEAMGRLAGGVAHDFNNVLTAIMGHANLLRFGLNADADRSVFEDLDGIMHAAGKASGITKQLLAFSRKQPNSPRDIDLSHEVDASEKMFRRLAGEAILLTVEKGQDIPEVRADPVQISQTLINLVVNARDALEGRTDGIISITVEGRSLEKPRRIGNRELASGRYAVLEVADNGSGMPESVAAKVFEPFFTTKAEGKGTGLGLSIVYAAAVASGGAVGLETAPGQGSRFSIWLPAAPRQAGADEAVDGKKRGTLAAAGAAVSGTAGASASSGISPNLGANSGASVTDGAVKSSPATSEFADPADAIAALRLPDGLRILLADDEEIVLGSLSRILSRAGAVVRAVRNPGEAILAAERESYDLLISDVIMPFMNGFDLAKRLKESGKTASSLFITGNPGVDRKMAGDSELLEKPFEAEDFLRAVLRAISR